MEHYDFNWYTYLDENAQTKQMTIAKICDILSWQNKFLGFMDQDGFKVPVHIDKEQLSSGVTLSDAEVDELSANNEKVTP